jgi:hypothetical protein
MFTRLCQILEYISREGVTFGFVENSHQSLNSGPNPILRHDIDFSLHGLDTLAKIESDLDHKAIYLFRPDALTYNLFSQECMNLVGRIQELGHKIGLHIDRRTILNPTSFDGFMQSVRERFSAEAGVSMDFVSWHRPHELDLGGPDLIFGMKSLYSESLWNKSVYISDSAGSWNHEKEHKLFQHCASKSNFQILIHPEWWINESAAESFSKSMSCQFTKNIYSLESELRTFGEFEIAEKIFLDITDLNNL